MSLLSWFLLVLALAASAIKAEIDTSGINQQINFLANEILGASKFQSYLDTLVYTPSSETSQYILDSVRDDLVFKLQKRVSAVSQLKTTIEANFASFTSTRQAKKCCNCCDSPEDTDEYGRLKFKSNVELDNMCHTNNPQTGTVKYPNDKLLDQMRENFDDNPNLKWQYFGGENGVMTIYPANKACDEKFDPRFRPWYSHAAFPSPKDVVIVIDRSGSMDTTYDRGIPLMDIAKEAANTVLDTLNPDDRVGVVFFSDDATTLSSGCYSNRLAEATPENKARLTAYVNTQTGSGNTYYSKAFQKAFDFFGSGYALPEFDKRERIKVILFLTDGRPSEQTPSTYLNVITNSNRNLNNEVVILTFGFGGGIGAAGETILTKIAHQNDSDPTAGPIRSGRFVYVSNPSNLRSSMARYYDFFSSSQSSDGITLSVPYVDAFGLGFITSVCLPIHFDNVFRGVTCIDMTISDLFTDATYFSRSADSYAFIADGRGRLIVHPLLPRPSDVYDHPVLLHVLDIETAPEMVGVVRDMLNGTYGSRTFESRRVLSRGDSTHEGVDTIRLESTYIWDAIGDAGLSDMQLCLVLATRDKRNTVTPTRIPSDFPYHRLDITQPPNTCRYINRVARTDMSTITFAPSAFLSPQNYLEQKETANTVNNYENYVMGSDEPLFNPGIREAVQVSSYFDDVIKKDSTSWQYSVWRYIAMKEGVLRLYPGSKLAKHFDSAQRPWYKRAVSQPDIITFSKPYVDAFGAGIIITLSKALYEGTSGTHTRDDPIAGAIGMDFTLDLFNSILSQQIPDCQTKTCIAIDNTGYIISHPDFKDVSEANFGDIENIHITQKEKLVAARLVNGNFLKEDQCINFRLLQIQSFWRAIPKVYTSPLFELGYLPDTNMYVIVKPLETATEGDCTCSVDRGLNIPECITSSTECECPCFSRDGVTYDPCDVKFTFNAEIGSKPPCTPPIPDVDLASIAAEENQTILDLQYCYDVETVCPTLDTYLNCSATAGCQWCGDKCTVRATEACSDDNDDNGSGGGGGSNVGGIVGGVIGALAGVGVVVAIIVVGMRKGWFPCSSSGGGSSGNAATVSGNVSSTQGGDLPMEAPPAYASVVGK